MEAIDREKWLDLAFSRDEDARKLALSFLPLVADEVQDELYIWYFLNDNFFVLQAIYKHLQEPYKTRAQQIEANQAPRQLVVGDVMTTFVIERETVRAHLLIKEYKELTNNGLFKAKARITALLKRLEEDV